MGNQDLSKEIEKELFERISGSQPNIILTDLFLLLRERWIHGTIAGMLVAGTFAFFYLRQTPKYVASAEIRVKLGSDRDKLIEINTFESHETENAALERHEKALKSNNFLEEVAAQLIKNDREQSQAIQSFLASAGAANGTDDSAATLKIVGRLATGLTISRQRGSQFFRVSFTSLDPDLSAHLANTITHAYRNLVGEQEDEKLERYQGNFTSLIKEADAEVRKATDALNEFRSNHAGNTTSAEVADTTRELIRNLNSRINNLAVQISDKELLLQRTQSGKENGTELAGIPEIAEYEGLLEAKYDLEQKIETQKGMQNDGLAGQHPDMLACERAIADAERRFSDTLTLAITSIKTTLDDLRTQKGLAVAELDSLNDEIVQGGQFRTELERLRYEVEQKQSRLYQLESRKDDLALLSQINTEDITVAAAQPNKKPVSPDKTFAAAASCTVFLLTFVGLPLFIGLLDNKVSSMAKLEEILGLECLATIPAKKNTASKTLAQTVLCSTDEQITEAFRVLYSSIRMATRNGPTSTLLITSSAPAEGKSFVTTNLAAFFAEQGRTTLIIDADYRKPTQHVNVEQANDRGIISWYQSDQQVPECHEQFEKLTSALGILTLGEGGNLYLLRAGGSSRAPTAMIESQRYAALLSKLKTYFDFIILDTPPAGLFPDALFLADYCDEIVFVTKHRSQPRTKLKFTCHKLAQTGKPILGIVVNQLKNRPANRYGYGYSDYGYGHYTARDYAKYYSNQDERS